MTWSLMPHQLQAVERGRHLKHMALFMDAGVGKTAAMIRILADEYNARGRFRNTLIFAPLSVCSQWPGEFKKFSNIPDDRILLLTGAGKERAEKLSLAIEQAKQCIVITNYESVLIKPFYQKLLQWMPELLVLDESHRVKDSQSKRAKCIYPLASVCDRRFLMTGTPVLNTLADIFGQFKALDPTIFGPGFWTFRTKYFYNRNSGRRNINFPDWQPFPTAAEEIGKKIAAVSVQAKRDECLHLPPLQTIPVPVELSPKQLKAYTEMKKKFVTELDGHVTSVDFEMTKTIRMQQILAGFTQPDDQDDPVWVDENPRLDALMDLVDGIGKEKCIIWTTFVPTYRTIGKRLEDAGYKCAFLTGEQTNGEKIQSIDNFRNGDVQFLISNPSCGGTGLNLQEARYAIYYARGYNLGDFIQSSARNYRSGTEKLHTSVCHYHLLAKGTLDEVIANALINKQNVADAVLLWARGNNT